MLISEVFIFITCRYRRLLLSGKITPLFIYFFPLSLFLLSFFPSFLPGHVTDREGTCCVVRGQLDWAGSGLELSCRSCRGETVAIRMSGNIKHAHPVFALGKVALGVAATG